MMKTIIVAGMCLLCTCFVQAQKKQKKTDKQKQDSVPAAVVTEKASAATKKSGAEKTSAEDGLVALAKEIADKNKEIKGLNDSITKLNNALKLKVSDFAQRLRQDSVAKVQKEKEVSSYKQRLKEQDDKIKAIGSLDEKVFNLFLLHSLEIRYTEAYTTDAITCLKALNIADNPKYKQYCDVYFPLLEKYKELNQGVLDYLNIQLRSFSLKQWSLNENVVAKAKADLANVPYYKAYYLKRNNPPYRSIIYLDDVITDYLSMLNGKSSLNKADFEALIKRLQPKK